MPIKQVVAPGDLGSEFDIGTEEADKIHVTTGRGLWRDGAKLESIPWKPEQRWVTPSFAGSPGPNTFHNFGTGTSVPPTWDALNQNQTAGMDDLRINDIPYLMRSFATQPVDIAIDKTAGSNYANLYNNVGNGIRYSTASSFDPGGGAGTVAGMSIKFSQPTNIVQFSLNPLGATPGETLMFAQGALWTTVFGSLAGGVGTDTAILGLGGTVTLSSGGQPISEIIFTSTSTDNLLSAGVLLKSLFFSVVPFVSGDLYTIQEYSDGRLLAVNDADRTDILESTAGMTLLDPAPLNNFTAGAAPSTGDDESGGYGRGSRWNDGANEYTCLDATAGAAVWILVA